jgi:hypothetical protein
MSASTAAGAHDLTAPLLDGTAAIRDGVDG